MLYQVRELSKPKVNEVLGIWYNTGNRMTYLKAYNFTYIASDNALSIVNGNAFYSFDVPEFSLFVREFKKKVSYHS